MSKIIFEFDGIEEQQEARDAMNGTLWKISMYDLDQKLRGTTKYGSSILGGEASDVEIEIAEKYRVFIRELLQENNLNFD
jgi:hypothetical protein